MPPIMIANAAKAADVVLSTHGLVAGTILLTLDGEIPVEHLTPGDRLITRNAGMAVLTNIRFRSGLFNAVQIRSGSLGHRRPGRDMIIGSETPVHLRDWRAQALFGAPSVTVPARRLIDGEFVKTIKPIKLAVFELEFDVPQILYADGVEIGSAAVARD